MEEHYTLLIKSVLDIKDRKKVKKADEVIKIKFVGSNFPDLKVYFIPPKSTKLRYPSLHTHAEAKHQILFRVEFH